MLSKSLTKYAYRWPQANLKTDAQWKPLDGQPFHYRHMPESLEELATDSRWPAFFPCPITLVTTTDGKRVGLEKEVGASIVNRFPYVMALSFCRLDLSKRHHARRVFMDILERGGSVAVQYLTPGKDLDRALDVMASIPDGETTTRIDRCGLGTRCAVTNDSPIFNEAYLVYEARLVKPGKDFSGQPIYQTSYVDLGSHRVYYLEITAIQLRQDIADGQSQIAWRSLPAWNPQIEVPDAETSTNKDQTERYRKGYSPNYRFPSANTTAFEYDYSENGMRVKLLPPLPEDQVEVDNDRARWPCFFPSSAGLISSWAEPGVPNLMPCGSATVLSRHPMVFGVAVSCAAINQRYAPRASLEILRRHGKFTCATPFIHDAVLDAIRYAGNTSLAQDRNKVANSGLIALDCENAPLLLALPVHFECEIIGEERLGTHVLFLGEVRRIVVRNDLTPQNPLEWCPWPTVEPASKTQSALAQFGVPLMEWTESGEIEILLNGAETCLKFL